MAENILLHSKKQNTKLSFCAVQSINIEYLIGAHAHPYLLHICNKYFKRSSHLVKEDSAVFSRAFHQVFLSSWVEPQVGSDVIDFACKQTQQKNIVTSSAARAQFCWLRKSARVRELSFPAASFA